MALASRGDHAAATSGSALVLGSCADFDYSHIISLIQPLYFAGIWISGYWRRRGSQWRFSRAPAAPASLRTMRSSRRSLGFKRCSARKQRRHWRSSQSKAAGITLRSCRSNVCVRLSCPLRLAGIQSSGCGDLLAAFMELQGCRMTASAASGALRRSPCFLHWLGVQLVFNSPCR